jgi:transposase
MAKYKHYDYSQRVLVPVSFEEQLTPGTLEFAIHTLVENRMDMGVFEERYRNDETGRWAYDPKILLKVVLLGYCRGLIPSRKIERACRENVTFMALTCGQCPDHSTIAAFVSSMKEEILSLFRDILLVCDEMGLLGGTMFALDGSKLPSNASKEWSGTLSDLKKKQQKLEKKVEQLLKQHVEADKQDDEDEKEENSSGLSNREKQIERLKKKAERIEKFLKENGAKIGRRGKEIKSNITDNDSATMFTSHGTIQGYNGQALVDSKEQVIVHAEAFGEGQDHHHIAPMVDGAKENMEALGHGEGYFEGKKLAADSNYHSPPNLNKCEEEGLDAYIPDINFRKRDQRFATQKRHRPEKAKRFGLEDFQHNEVTDTYICPQGKALKRWGKEAVMDGVIYKRYAADKNDCRVCELRLRCIRGQNGKRKYLSVPLRRIPGSLTQAMVEKIDTEQGRDIYNKRIGIVEPVFANIRFQKRLDRFWLRGKTNVNIQWLLYCMVHNIGKIMRYGFA